MNRVGNGESFSVLEWAAANNCAIAESEDGQACLLSQRTELLLESDFPVVGHLPDTVRMGQQGDAGILISWKIWTPFSATLRLIPRILHIGIGCRRGITEAEIGSAVESVLSENSIDRRAIKQAASIDLKADEEGLVAFCRSRNWPISFYSAAQLQEMEGDFTPSAFVKQVTGVDNVCERSALRGARRLVVRKAARNGVTIALAEEEWQAFFGPYCGAQQENRSS